MRLISLVLLKIVYAQQSYSYYSGTTVDCITSDIYVLKKKKLVRIIFLHNEKLFSLHFQPINETCFELETVFFLLFHSSAYSDKSYLIIRVSC